MNESDFYKTVVQQEIVDDGAIRRYAKAAKPKRSHTFLRVLIPVAATLLLVVGVTMAIPSARAEVLSWFKPTTAGEYFSQPADEREPNEQLDALIVPGEQSETHVEVQGAASDAIFTEIAKALETAELGDTMFDGENLYIRMRANGIAMLAEIESMTGGNLTKNIIPPKGTPAYFEDYHTPEEFLSGEIPFWADADVRTSFTFTDGTRVYGGEFASDYTELLPLTESLRRDDLDHGYYAAPEQYAAVNARELAYLKDRTIDTLSTTLMQDWTVDPDQTLIDVFRRNADENGVVTVTVGMEIWHDLAEEPWGEKKLDATLGEVKVDLEAYKSLKKTELKPDGSKAVFAPKQTLHTVCDWKSDENGVPYAVYRNETVDLSGLSLEPVAGAYIDARGIQNLCIRVTPPKDWNRKMLEQLSDMLLDFSVLINGQTLGSANDVRFEIRENGTMTITIGCISGVPLDQLTDVETVTLIPTLSYVRYRRIYAENSATLTDIELEPGIPYIDNKDAAETWIGETIEYPQYAVTFTVD